MTLGLATRWRCWRWHPPRPGTATVALEDRCDAARRGGRRRNIERRAIEIQAALRSEQLAAPPALSAAYGAVARSTAAIVHTLSREIATLEEALGEGFDAHPDAEIIRSLPGVGIIIGGRVLGEFGDDPTRFEDAKSPKNYGGSAPITRASGRSKVVLARHARNRRLADALQQWAFCSLQHSPGARAYYDQLRARGKTHNQALRQLATRWVGILHVCLERRVTYDKHTAWGHHIELAA